MKIFSCRSAGALAPEYSPKGLGLRELNGDDLNHQTIKPSRLKSISKTLLLCWMLSLLYISTSFAITPEEEEKLLRETGQELVCTCGCGNMILDICTCGNAAKWKQFLRGQIREGKTKEQMLKIMSDKYGEQVLAAPPKVGINWILWVVIPYLVPVLGAVVLAAFLLKWVKRRKDQPSDTQTSGEQINRSQYDEQIDKELKDFEE
ncbi:MAG: cytochrome c-type biogenesis protein CcmH [Candidatus Schekmanbacteria bacterium]|nr:cytochrome c-type biogenesis protein CcmH [Candidatus Schekmanbacteria bacterium]